MAPQPRFNILVDLEAAQHRAAITKIINECGVTWDRAEEILARQTAKVPVGTRQHAKAHWRKD
jgi:predicted transcriptional regulator